jgi:hypothetical protein
LRAPLPRKSASMGLRNVIARELGLGVGVFLQKTTTLVKSGEGEEGEEDGDLGMRGSRGSSSRKARHEGKTARMVRRTCEAAGRERSPA